MNLRCSVGVQAAAPTVRCVFSDALYCGCCGSEGLHRKTGAWTSVTLHQLSLVDVSNPPLQLLRVLREELELGAVALWVFAGVVVANFSWRKVKKTQKRKSYDDFLIHLCLYKCDCLPKSNGSGCKC